MNQKEWDSLLDEALTRQKFESLADILADYPAEAGVLRPLLTTASALESLEPVVLPPLKSMASNRETFLTQVDQLPVPVSIPLLVRLKGWITNPFSRFIQLLPASKEANKMSGLLLRAALVIVMLFGAAGGTAMISAESLPDSALYPVKLVVEDTRLALTADPENGAELNLALAETRLDEISEMSLEGKVPSEAVFNRLEEHLNEALRLAAQMPEDAMNGFLVQAQNRIQSRINALVQARERVSGSGEAGLDQANGLLNRFRVQVEAGLQAPQMFREQNGRMPEGAPGPCWNDECEPAGNNNQYGPGPSGDGGYGPGDGDGVCDNPDGCEPVGDENHYGPGPSGDGGYGPGDGDGVCDNPDGCEPVGDENHYGSGQQENENGNTGNQEPGGMNNNQQQGQNNGQGGGNY